MHFSLRCVVLTRGGYRTIISSMGKWLSLVIFTLSIFVPLFPVESISAAEQTSSVLINEIRLGGDALPYGDGHIQEYVTLFNGGDTEVSLEGWAIEYAKNPTAELASTFCHAASWSGFSGVTVTSVNLGGVLTASGVSSPIRLQLNDSGSGSLRLINASNPEQVIVHDLIGWGNDAPCAEGTTATTPTRNRSLLRYLACETDAPIDTDDNAKDLGHVQVAAPGQINSEYNVTCGSDTPDSSCEGVVITEILPNPAGADTGNEFIELYNPSDSEKVLDGCMLYISGATKTFTFPTNTLLAAMEYRAFYDGTTGLTLPNANGGEVVLVAGNTEYPYTYPQNMKSGESWAIIEGTWQATNNPTPHAPNEPTTVDPGNEGGLADCGPGRYRHPETNRCRNIVSTAGTLQPCEEGKERNPATNRCRSIIATLASLIPCKPGQERNPATNRCRSVLSSSTSLVPCKPGQERNPATNRCRSIASASSTLKPCAEGQERNPETNRCRKVASQLANASHDQDDSKSDINYGLLGLAGITAVGYGAYEYRNDLRAKFLRVKARFFSGANGK